MRESKNAQAPKMDDDDGRESFDINDTDLEYALNPGGRRHFQTKDDAIYGVFRPDSDDDDEQGTSRSGPTSKKSRYTAPVGFVSGGVQTNTKIDKDDPESLNLGTYSSKPKMDEEDDAIELNFNRRQKKQPKQEGAQVFAGMRTSATSGAVDTNRFGNFLNHGNGSVIMKMMSKMGYKAGEGLGAQGQGIVEPVQAAVRKGRGAVGAYGKEMTGPKFGESAADAQKRIGSQSGASRDDEDQENSSNIPKIKGSWKKAQKVKTKYRTIEDVLEEGVTASRPSVNQNSQYSTTKVIDMTGKQQKIYSGYDSFSMKTRSEYDNVDEEERSVFDVPELVHNLNLLVDLTEESIRRSNQQLLGLKDQTTALEYDLEQSQKTFVDEEKEVQHMKDVYELIDGFSSNRSPTMEECQNLFRRIRTEYPHEYQLHSLESVAIPIVLPLILRHFATWKPLESKDYGTDLITEWREILEADKGGKAIFGQNRNNFGGKNETDDQIPAYDRLIWEGVLPTIRRACLAWDPRSQMHEMIEMVEQWIPILPKWIKENILEQLIVPKISERVDQWDPMTDVIPIHEWLVPWNFLLGDRMKAVMPPIRQKLAKALKLWDPADRSALATLRPWQNVWSAGTFSAFIGQNVVPKLGNMLNTFQLDPNQNPEYPEWDTVMEWLELTHPDAIANIVTKYFFTRFHEALCSWLDSPVANINEVKSWYGAWKNRIPAAILAFPTINENLRRAMISIGRSLQGEKVSNIRQAPPTQMAPPPQPNIVPLVPHGNTNQQLSLKDVIEITANRNGFTYHPQKDRFKDGRQVFWFGAVSIYLDAGMVYVMDPVEFVWRPTGLDELTRMAG
uniref:Septin and tuftelin-interacting protein 1 homolog n=1 Tax=Caenorhabditis japonica TaxID=281687 RepID=A0A8R1HS39_CAEJA